MKLLVPALLFAAALALPACAPVVAGGPPLSVPIGLQETAQVGTITMSSAWLDAEDDFSDTFTDEVHEELRQCMRGTAPINVRIHLDRMDRAGRLQTLLSGDGEHRLRGTVEFVDPTHDNRIVGRVPIDVTASVQGRLDGLLGDRQMIVSEAFGRAVCQEAFGRNPRAPGPQNATRG